MSEQSINIRPAEGKDIPAVVALVQELARSIGETSPLTADYVRMYLETKGVGIILAEDEREILGLLSYTLKPNLYHAGNCCIIEELIVAQKARSHGVGKILVEYLIDKLRREKCAEISVSAVKENTRAIEFYRRLGLTDEAVYLEKHFK